MYFDKYFFYFFLQLLPIFLLIVSFSFCLIMVLNNRKKKMKHKLMMYKFFELLTNNYCKGIIKDKNDILLLLNSIGRGFEKNNSLISILEDYIVHISTNKNINASDIYPLIKNIILVENQEKPFNSVPEEEKRILMSINENYKYNDLESAKLNLQELASVISTRNKIYRKTDIINKWALPIAIIGIILTITFGLIGFKSIDYKKIEEINKNLIEMNKVPE